MPDNVNLVLKSAVYDFLPASAPQLTIIWGILKWGGKVIRIGWYVYEGVRLHSPQNRVTMTAIGAGFVLEGIGDRIKAVQLATQVVYTALILEKAAEQVLGIQADLAKFCSIFTRHQTLYIQSSYRLNPNHKMTYMRKLWPILFKEGIFALLDIPLRIFKMSMYFLDAKAAITSDRNDHKDHVRKIALYSADLWNTLDKQYSSRYLEEHEGIINKLMSGVSIPWNARILLSIYKSSDTIEEAMDLGNEIGSAILSPFFAVSEGVVICVEAIQVVYSKVMHQTGLLMRMPHYLIPKTSRSFRFHLPGNNNRFIDPPEWKVLKDKVEKKWVSPQKRTFKPSLPCEAEEPKGILKKTLQKTLKKLKITEVLNTSFNKRASQRLILGASKQEKSNKEKKRSVSINRSQSKTFEEPIKGRRHSSCTQQNQPLKIPLKYKTITGSKLKTQDHSNLTKDKVATSSKLKTGQKDLAVKGSKLKTSTINFQDHSILGRVANS